MPQQLELKISAIKPAKPLLVDKETEKWEMLKAHYQHTYRYATKKGQKVLRYQIKKLNSLILGLLLREVA